MIRYDALMCCTALILSTRNSDLSQELQRRASLRSLSAETATESATSAPESGSVNRISSDSGYAASTGGAMTRMRASSMTLTSGRGQESGDGHDSASDGVLPADSCVMS